MIDEKTQVELEKSLSSLGLTTKESSVYLALLSLGLVGSSKVINKTGLHGQFVYQSLEALEQKGLIQHVVQNNRKKFSAKPPSTLLNLIEQQRRTAESVVSLIQSAISMPTPQQLEVFQGQDSFVAEEFRLLDQASIESSLLVIGGTGDQFLTTMGKDLTRYDITSGKKHIQIRYIGCEAQRDTLKKSAETRSNFQFRLLPGTFSGEVNTNIWNEYVSFNIFGEPLQKVTLQSKTIANSYQQFFETLWNMGK